MLSIITATIIQLVRKYCSEASIIVLGTGMKAKHARINIICAGYMVAVSRPIEQHKDFAPFASINLEAK